MLNEVEIVTWYCFLKRQRYNVQSVENIIKCAAYCAKESLNEEQKLKSYESYFQAYEK